MAGPACKVIINNQTHGLSYGLAEILTNPDIHGGRLPEDKRLRLLQRLADIDIAMYTGADVPRGGLSGVLMELENAGIVTAEVWEILRKPVA